VLRAKGEKLMQARWTWIIVTAAAALTTTGVALAGSRAALNVTISTANRTAYGTLGTVHNSADSTQAIACTTNAYASGSYWSYCYAFDTSNNFGSCTSSSEAISSVIRGMNGDSYVYFAWDTNGTCTQVSLVQGSPYEPKR
jgi:hypothetical protein